MDKFIIDDKDLQFKYAVYKSSLVMNLTTRNEVKPSKDKRRPNEPPIIYLKKKDGKRVFIYHDILMAICFYDGYDKDCCIFHKDGDATNCAYDNLLIYRGLDILTEYFHETKEWRKVEIEEKKLYYNYYICEDGRLFNATTASYVLPFKDSRDGNYGYLRYNLYYGKTIKETIHVAASRLVALHFIPVHPDNKDVVLFIDRDHDNLHYKNLQWGDAWDSYNQKLIASIRDDMREFTTLNHSVLGKEKWKDLDIPGVHLVFDYKVSNFGRVYNDTKKFYCSNRGDGCSNLNNQEHQTVSLKTDKGYKVFGLHRLVAFMFCENKNPKICTFVNHINGNPECNLSINLEWVTPLENLKHAIDTNLRHSCIYDDKVNTNQWRLNTILAWLFSMDELTNHQRYLMYIEYHKKYNDDIPDLSETDFIKAYEEKISTNKDFEIICNYYKSNY